jgi:hypothetical protein
VNWNQGILNVTNDTARYFIADTYRYFNTQDPNGLLTDLRSFRNVLERRSLNDASLSDLQITEHKTRTIGLYTLIGCLTAAYLKAAVDWRWSREFLVAYQYQQYQAALGDWKANTATDPTYKDRNPLQDLAHRFPGVNLDPKYKPPDWNTWITYASCPVPVFISAVQLMLDYCVGTPDKPGLYTIMLKT